MRLHFCYPYHGGCLTCMLAGWKDKFTHSINFQYMTSKFLVFVMTPWKVDRKISENSYFLSREVGWPLQCSSIIIRYIHWLYCSFPFPQVSFNVTFQVMKEKMTQFFMKFSAKVLFCIMITQWKRELQTMTQTKGIHDSILGA